MEETDIKSQPKIFSCDLHTENEQQYRRIIKKQDELIVQLILQLR